MTRKLLIVESPAKAKTIGKYLSGKYDVLASFGHVRDLPKKNGSIDTEHDFKPKFQLIVRNKKQVDAILNKAKIAEEVYLASDQDREGEAIAWHIYEILQTEGVKAKIYRVSFNEITKPAIIEAMKNPRDIDYDLVDSQLARLSLDYLLGFNVSPLLWRKIKTGLSAGRVQSPALRLICEREKEIKDFVAEDYFWIHLLTQKEDFHLNAKLIEFKTQKIETKTLKTKLEAAEILNQLKPFNQVTVANLVKKNKRKRPLPPFITSSLQIEGVRKLGYTTDRIMKIAQNLYEGVDIGNETVGLITYMRTDSVQLSNLAIDEIRTFISEKYNSQYLPAKPNTFTNKAKNAQEAHEAIRPTSILRTPTQLKAYLNNEQYKLYELIWQRALASQMAEAILETTQVNLSLGEGIFRLNGVRVAFNGFLVIYQESVDETQKSEDDELSLPALNIGESLNFKGLEISEHQTEPKARYSEASLVKELEELGIGRPSTYASIISTLKKREYVILDKKRFIPTDIGEVVNQFLTKHLTKYVDFQFTANLENVLDEIANGKTKKLPVLQSFWTELKAVVTEKQGVSKLDLISKTLEEDCPNCGKKLIERLGKFGKFIGCSGYPDCNYMRKITKEGDDSEKTEEPVEVEGRLCPQDNGKLLIRNGKYGKFIACSNYPKCKYIESVNMPELGSVIDCPECKKGKIVAKKGRFGVFYSCNNYPSCKTIFKYEPHAESCTNCGYPILMHHITKRRGLEKICPKCNDIKTS